MLMHARADVLAKIAAGTAAAVRDRQRRGAPGMAKATSLARGSGWSVSDVVCTCGPDDRVFEEAHTQQSIGVVLSGTFAVEGSDWFELSGRSLTWEAVRSTLDATQQRLAGVVADIASGALASPLDGRAQFDLVLGIACHAVYHAGQIQLIKALRAVP